MAAQVFDPSDTQSRQQHTAARQQEDALMLLHLFKADFIQY